MAFNIISELKEYLNNDLVSKLSQTFNESESDTQKAVDGIVPVAVGSLISQAQNSPSGLSGIFNLVKSAGNTSWLDTVSGLFKGDSNPHLNTDNSGILSNLFSGDLISKITSVISSFSGVKNETSKGLLAVITPLVLHLFGKKANQEGLSESGFASLLSSQKSNLEAAVPSGLGGILSGAGLGSLSNWFSTGSHAATGHDTHVPHTPPTYNNQTEEPKSNSWLPWLLLAIAALAIWFFSTKGCNASHDAKDGHEHETVAVDTNSHHTDEPTSEPTTYPTINGKLDTETNEFWYEVGDLKTFDLPNGAKIEIPEFSTEANLIKFLNDNNAKIDSVKGNWFEFTNVKFKTGGTEISDTSLLQLQNLEKIARAYPKAVFKIGGYTDNTGDSAKNVTLSQKRAEVVFNTLKKLGVSAKQLTNAEGYGPLWPIADNATAEGRAINRRVAINVKEK